MMIDGKTDVREIEEREEQFGYVRRRLLSFFSLRGHWTINC